MKDFMNELRKEQVLKIIIRKKGQQRENLLTILLTIQEASGRNYVHREWAKWVAEELGLPLSKVYDVLTFLRHVFHQTTGQICAGNLP